MIGKWVKVSFGKSSIVGRLESIKEYREYGTFAQGDTLRDVTLRMDNSDGEITWEGLFPSATIEIIDE